MNEIIELRAHHLGEMYDIFAGLLSLGVKSNEKIITNLISRRIDDLSSCYPKETLIKLRDILSKFFFSDTITIVFKKGPDIICESGCLSFNKESIANAESEHVKIAKITTIIKLCESNNPKEDVVMEEIFDLELGREYRKVELESKMIKVFKRHKKIYWKRLSSLNEFD